MVLLFTIFIAISFQEPKVGGPCEGCEAIYEYGSKVLTQSDTLADFHLNGPKMKISGTVFHRDGKTPASSVIIYLYHTDQNGIYPKKGNEKGWGRRHGYLRGWTKTNSDGKYEFYTLKPAAYPSRSNPAHVHITIKEPGLNEYYIDDILFEDDPYLTSTKRNNRRNRGGPGIISLFKNKNGLLVCKRDIVLGMNIPNYPKK